MFVLDYDAGRFDVFPGCECYARYADGYYYNGVLNKLEGISGEVSFHPNRGKRFKHLDAPVGVTALVPMNDIVNLSWGICNFGIQANYSGQYYGCNVGEVAADGRLHITYLEDGMEDSLTYDFLRLLEDEPIPMYPAAFALAKSFYGADIDVAALTEEEISRVTASFAGVFREKLRLLEEMRNGV
ncbi:hypothetical protein LJC56_08350 [Christensenellaceae bacterium OttesenSCG-928-K19]|nr:hypothetical protein [Christensenellaceae bacterium OttesenSCG-928-K19]